VNKKERLEVARALRGKFVRFHDDSKVSRGYLVTGVDKNGMIELDGWAGLFDPCLFERVDHPHTADDTQTFYNGIAGTSAYSLTAKLTQTTVVARRLKAG
jgi:hypothetical protein